MFTHIFFIFNSFSLKKIIGFLPRMSQKHFFLLCYNLRDSKLEKIIDNMLIRTTFKVAYGDFSVKLVSLKNYIVYNHADVITLQF